MQMIRLAVGIVLGSLVGFTQPRELQDQFKMSDYRLPFNERLRIEAAAPIILFGKVLSVSNVGTAQRSTGDTRIKTQLTQIRIDVEETIKGSVDSNPLQFYFFTYSAENEIDLGIQRYMPEVGQRRIYFLKPWDHMYRSVGDVTTYNLPVHSGTHPKGFCQGKEPGCCMAEILLGPQPDIDVEWFVHDLGPSSTYAAGVLCSPRKAEELVGALTRHSDTRIAGAATDTISMLKQWWPELKSNR